MFFWTVRAANGVANPANFDHLSNTMAILKIARMGHPVLRRSAEPVADCSEQALHRMIADMGDTMRVAPGVGLAAPQVFSGTRVIVFRVPTERDDDDDGDRSGIPETALINPEITPLTDRLVLGWEGCLSVPGLRGLVPRYPRIGYRGWRPDGSLVENEASGFLARVIQHECDHLDGILYIDRMPDLRLLVFEEEIGNFKLSDYDDDDA